MPCPVKTVMPSMAMAIHSPASVRPLVSSATMRRRSWVMSPGRAKAPEKRAFWAMSRLGRVDVKTRLVTARAAGALAPEKSARMADSWLSLRPSAAWNRRP